MSECLQVLFPAERNPKKAQSALTSLRKRLNDAAKKEGAKDLGLRFEVDTKKQNPPTERFCWFTGPDPAVKQVERYSDQVTADIRDRHLVPTQGIATSGAAMASGKRPVRFFVSYARADLRLVKPFLKELRTQFASSRNYELILWMDQDVDVGEQWHEGIDKALRACDCSLLLLSPAFFASKFIVQHELPLLVGESDNTTLKPIIPVGLIPVSPDRQNLQGLERHVIFLGRTARIEGLFFEQLQGSAKKRDFVHDLYNAIEKRLDGFFASQAPSHPLPSGDLANHVPIPEGTRHFQRTRGHRIALGDLERIDTGRPYLAVHVKPRDAIEELESWATNPNPDAPPFFALLGEYGIGKTTTLKQFTRYLLDRRKSDPGLPLPIYVDLRSYVGESKDSVPTIEQLLASVIERSWKSRSRDITPRDLFILSIHFEPVNACAWSPDGQRLLSVSNDNILKAWDASSGQCLLTLSGHSDGVTACAWSPDGQRLLSASNDSSLKVWDASSGRCLWSGRFFLGGHTAAIDEVNERVLYASPEAWRWLGWRWTDPATGQLRILPAEAFGPLPT